MAQNAWAATFLLLLGVRLLLGQASVAFLPRAGAFLPVVPPRAAVALAAAEIAPLYGELRVLFCPPDAREDVAVHAQGVAEVGAGARHRAAVFPIAFAVVALERVVHDGTVLRTSRHAYQRIV